jgi:hypothetical protein
VTESLSGKFTGIHRMNRILEFVRSPLILFILCIPVNLPAVHAATKVQFSRQVLPVLRRECSVCHAGAAAPGGFSMETAPQLLAGGRHGAAVTPGKSAQSTMIRYLIGELKPQMPPGKPLPLETIALLRRWIDEGAKIDSMTLPAEPAHSPSTVIKGSPETARSHPTNPAAAVAPVTAAAFSPDGKLLAAGGYRAVRLVDPATGAITRILPGPVDQVLCVAWSPDGKWLAASGGLPGSFGEVCLWSAPQWGRPRVLRAHADTIYSVAWRPHAPEFATASLDKTVAIWSFVTLAVTRTLKDHADAVFCVAYSPDGKWLATGSADRTVKLYQTNPIGRPVAGLSHGDAVTALAFNAKSNLLVTACMDKRVRVWPVKAESIENPLRDHGEGEAVNAVAFSADGSAFLWGAANHKVRLWDGDVSNQKQEMSGPGDWVYTVAASPDGKLLAAGGGDGKLYFWQPDGKLIRSVLVGGSPVLASATPAHP